MSKKLLIHKLHFARLFWEIAVNQMVDVCFITSATTAVQETAGGYLVGLFVDTNVRTIHGKCINYAKKYTIGMPHLWRNRCPKILSNWPQNTHWILLVLFRPQLFPKRNIFENLVYTVSNLLYLPSIIHTLQISNFNLLVICVPLIFNVNQVSLFLTRYVFNNDLAASQESYQPTNDREATLHDTVWSAVKDIFPRISQQKIASMGQTSLHYFQSRKSKQSLPWVLLIFLILLQMKKMIVVLVISTLALMKDTDLDIDDISKALQTIVVGHSEMSDGYLMQDAVLTPPVSWKTWDNLWKQSLHHLCWRKKSLSCDPRLWVKLAHLHFVLQARSAPSFTILFISMEENNSSYS